MAAKISNPREVIRAYIASNGKQAANDAAAAVYAYTVIDCDPDDVTSFMIDNNPASNNYDPDMYIFDGIDELAELFADNPAELARAVFYGDVDHIDGPLYFDVYGHLYDADYENNEEYAEAMLAEDISDALVIYAARDDWDNLAEIIRALIDAGEEYAAAQLGASVHEYAERLAERMAGEMAQQAA